MGVGARSGVGAAIGAGADAAGRGLVGWEAARAIGVGRAPIAAPTPDLAPTPTDPPDDSVHMLVDGHAVAITVRDGTLSDGEALHAAFEAARVVAGEGRALRQLTLNGRVLYQRPEGADDPPPRAGSFAC